MRYRLAIFDFDGTLADTTPFHARAFQEVFAPFGIAVDYRAIAGMRTAEVVSALLARAGVVLPAEQADSLCRAKQRLARTLISRELSPLPGVADFLHFARRSYRLAIYSSGSRATVEAALERLGFSGWFDPLLCAEDVREAKPHPEGFLRVLELTRVPAAAALVFEDSRSGLLSAGSAGIKAVCVDPSSAAAGIHTVPWPAWQAVTKGAPA